MDWLTWVLLGVMGLALMGWWMWRQRTRGPDRTIDPAKERGKGADMIPPEVPGAAANIFRLSENLASTAAGKPLPVKLALGSKDAPSHQLVTCVRLRATSLTEPFVSQAGRSSFDPAIRDALWVQQRQLIARLESELDIPLQAELSPHFVVVTGTNQPRAFLGHALADAEKCFALLKNVLRASEPLRLWLGRGMIVLLSNRRLFDHVAWLTATKVTLSSEGSYFLADDRIVFIPIYMSLVAESRRALVKQVVGAWLHCTGGIAGDYPRWVTEGLGRWVEASLGEWIEGQIGWMEDGIAAQPVKITTADGETQPASAATPAGASGAVPKLASAKVQAAEQIKILLPAAWERADIDPPLLESMRLTSHHVIDWLMATNQPALLLFLKSFKAATSEDAAWRGALGMDSKGLLAAYQASGHAPRETQKAALPQGVTAIDSRMLDRSV